MKIIFTLILSLAVLAGCASTGTKVEYESLDKKLFVESDSDLAGLSITRNTETGELEIKIGPVENSNALENAAAGIITLLPSILAPAK